MKRIAAILAVLMSIALGAPASASNTTNNPTWTTPTRCINYSGNIVTCAYIAWHRQGDDTGVNVESLHVWTSQGCSSLEHASFNPYGPVTIFTNPPGGSRLDYFNYGDEQCTFDHYPGWLGPDGGAVDFHLNIHARINNDQDETIAFAWRVATDGTHVLLEADCPTC